MAYSTPPINFAQFCEKIEQEKAVPVEMPDGTIYKVRPPELLPDAAFDRVVAGDLDEEVLHLLMPDYDKFAAAGGSRILLASIIAQAVTDRETTQGPVGKPEASSSS